MGPAPIGFGFPGDDNPAEKISWDDIQGFEAATGLGLPTEAQWEYACRAGTPGQFAGTGDLDDMGWYSVNSGDTTHPVDQKQPNKFGLHDMHGNVFEWCEDVYDAMFYSKDVPGFDPLSTAGSEFRVIRGGSLSDSVRNCRSAFRFRVVPARGFFNVGFRPAVPTP